MRRTKIIDRPDQIHTVVQCQCAPHQCPTSAYQWGEAFTERRIQPLNIGRIDHASALRAAPQCLHACRCAIDDTPFRLDHQPSLVALDHLGDQVNALRADFFPPPRV
jgi:hypothetical protein